MRELKIGEKTIRVRATPLALLYYKQEFSGDLMRDVLKLSKMGEDFEAFDSIKFLQIVWAMAKANKFGQEFPSFETWLTEELNEEFDFIEAMTLVIEEAGHGFFRRGIRKTKQSKGKK